MNRLNRLPRNVAAVLTFARPPLVFGAFVMALWVMLTQNPLAYLLGVSLLTLAMAFDWIDGWFAERYIPQSKLGPLADRMMDRVVLTIIFPVLAAGMVWRHARLEQVTTELANRPHLLHTLLVVGICVLVLMRDQFAQFLRSFRTQDGGAVESYELTRLRTILASPMVVLLYAYAFYLPADGWEWLYTALSWIDQLPLRVWFVLELFFLGINIVSITPFLRRYGMLALDDICEDDELLRRRILAVFPNTLTLMNGLLGVTAVFFASYGRVKEALFIIVGAAFFDRLDGSLARRLGLTEPLPDQPLKLGMTTGALLDDISDMISFVIAPALIFHFVLGEILGETLALVVVVAYLLGGAGRLTYFSLDKNPVPGFFKGVPVPGAALLVMGPIEMANWAARAYPGETALLMARFSAVMMIVAVIAMNAYFVRYLHFGRFLGRNPWVLWPVLAVWVLGVFTPYYGMIALAASSVYLFSPLFTGRIDPAAADIEKPKGKA